MNICSEITDALQLGSDTVHVKDKVYPILVQRVVDYARNLDEKEQIDLTGW